MLKEKVASLPDSPGVYLWRDERGAVLYVGKALSLRTRVRSYLQPAERLPPKTVLLMEAARDVEVITTQTEVEALILEANLIKRYRPRYNILLKDDKSYPYLKITSEEFPRLLVVRAVEPDGARYFGPFPRAGAVNETVRLLRSLFPLRSCSPEKFRQAQAERPCLDYHIRRCQAPCRAFITSEEYARLSREVALFLQGRTRDLLRNLERQMAVAAKDLRFEDAATLRDRIGAVRRLSQSQRIVSVAGGELDVLGLAQEDGEAMGQIFFVREGHLIGRESLALTGTAEGSAEEILLAFIQQFYLQAAYVPPEIILPRALSEAALLERWLRDRRGSAVRLWAPRRGPKVGLLELAAENARVALTEDRRQRSHRALQEAEALGELARLCELPRPPERIEGIDISHLRGEETVASLVVFQGARPRKESYRRFRLATGGGDDYAALQEVVRRRFARARQAEAVANDWGHLPDLLLIDGGLGQLRAVAEALAEMGVEVPLISIAKAEELLFRPGSSEPLRLPGDDPARRLLQRVRDEAHRFALTYHRERRGKASQRSLLDEVPGIGPRRKQALLRAFGSVNGLRSASAEDIRTAAKLDPATLERLKERLK